MVEHQMNNLGSFKNADTGEVVMEMFSAPSALTKGADFVSQGLYLLSETLTRGLDMHDGGGFLGGQFGYGVKFENDVFLMYPDYMDAECKCGYDERTEPLWKQWNDEHDHLAECYYRVLNAKMQAYGEKIGWSWDDPDHKLWNKYRKYE